MSTRILNTLATQERSIPSALELTEALKQFTQESGLAWISASIVTGPAVILGARQRLNRVVDLALCAQQNIPIYARTTTGTAVYIKQSAVVVSLVLPNVGYLANDATMTTILNRNVRGFLQGFSKSGIPANYFGREWISAKQHPIAVMGIDSFPYGETQGIVIELFVGYDDPLNLPTKIMATEEQQLNRWLGKDPAAITALSSNLSVHELTTNLVTHCATRWGAQPMVVPFSSQTQPFATKRIVAIERSSFPLQPQDTKCVSVQCPIGLVEAAVMQTSNTLWLGGDVLCSNFYMDSIGQHCNSWEKIPVVTNDDVPLLGATMREYQQCARLLFVEPPQL